MRSQFSWPSAGPRRFLLISVVLPVMVALVKQPVHGFPGLPGDYNQNGIVSHGDYSVLGDSFGSIVPPGFGADGNGNGIVDNGDFDIYRTNYGDTASAPGVLPIVVAGSPTPGGNIEWTITFSNVNGALAGHLNISTSGPSILSAVGGPGFLDDGDGTLEVPGKNAVGTTQEGISFSGNKAFAALGSTLSTSPLLHNSNSSLEFLRLITAGPQPTTLTYSGEYGYQNLDYMVSGSATSVPEPASGTMALIAAVLLCIPRTVVSRWLLWHSKPWNQ